MQVPATVDWRESHLSSSRRTSSSALCAEGRNFPNTTETHWRDQNYTQIWTYCKKNVLLAVGMWTWIEVSHTLGKDSRRSPSVERTHRGFYVVWTDKNSSNYQTLIICGLKLGPQFRTKLSKHGRTRNQSPRLRGFYSSDAEDGDTDGGGYALWTEDDQASQKKTAKTKGSDGIQKNVEAHESTRQRLESSLPKDHEDHIAGQRIQFDDTLQLGSQVYSNALKRWKFRMREQQWTRNGRSSRQIQHEIWEKVKQKGVYSGCTKIQKESRVRSKIQKYKGRVVQRGDIV